MEQSYPKIVQIAKNAETLWCLERQTGVSTKVKNSMGALNFHYAEEQESTDLGKTRASRKSRHPEPYR